MEQKPRWNWVITLAAAFLAFCLGFGVARWTQHTDGVTVRTARTIPAQTESALPVRPGGFRSDREIDGSADRRPQRSRPRSRVRSISTAPRRRS